MSLGRRLALVVLVLVEIGVVVAAMGWLQAYFHPPSGALHSSAGGSMFSLRYPEVGMPLETGQLVLSFVVGYAAVAGIAGKQNSVGMLRKLLPFAAIAAVVLAAMDVNALYSFHAAFAAMESHTHGAFGSSLAKINDAALRNGLTGTLAWTLGRLATYGVVYAYVGRRQAPQEAGAET